jgi:sortase B
MKIINIIDRLLNGIITIALLILFLFSFYSLYDVKTVYDDSILEEDILVYKPNYEMELFDLKELQVNINEDIIAWIQIDETNIDYPVLYSKDNIYIENNYKKYYSSLGSIFLNNKNDINFNDDYSIIYGHNNDMGLMFSDIKKYSDKDYFDNHSNGKLYTNNCVYNMEILSYNIIDSNSDLAFNIDKYKNNSNDLIYSHLKQNHINTNDIKITNDDKLILLSTCNDSNSSLRSVLLAKLEKSNNKKIVTNSHNNGKYSANQIQTIRKENNIDTSIFIMILIIIILLIIIHIIIRIKRFNKEMN